MFGLGWAEVLIVVAIALFFFGKHLPQVARWLGLSLVEIKKEVAELRQEVTGPAK